VLRLQNEWREACRKRVARNGAMILLASLLSSCAHSVWPASYRPSSQAELLRIEAEIARANRECDYAYFTRIEAPEFFFVGPSGRVTTRAEDLAGERDCKTTDHVQTLDQVRLVELQNGAVFSARATRRGTGRDGKPFERASRLTDVFVYRDGTWQLVAGHESAIPSEGQAPKKSPE
jgi:ketosteroid isomerase-like protein